MKAPVTPRRCADCNTTFRAKWAKYCPDCRWRHRGKGRMYEWTPERDDYLREHYDVRVKQRSTAIAAHFGWPRWAVMHRAIKLGLTRAKEPLWTPGQIDFLTRHAHKRTSKWIWMHLPEPRRTETAIILKMRKMCGGTRVSDGSYTLRGLVLLFGCDHRVIQRWVGEGKLSVHMRGYRTSRDAWAVDPDDVREFIRTHRDTYDLRRVDQSEFMALVLDGAQRRQRKAA